MDTIKTETKETKVNECRINKYFGSDIEKYDGRLN